MSALISGLQYSAAASIPDLFRAAASRFADASALISEDGSWTYSQLLTYSHSVAQILHSNGIGAGEVVGIVATRSAEVVGGMLGVLFAGAAYLPIDPATTPLALLERQLSAAHARVILYDPQHTQLSGAFASLLTLALPHVCPSSSLSSKAVSPLPIDAGSPAYVMFTSGSTGTPKGVIVPHRAVGRLVCGQEYVRFAPEQRFLLHSPLGFDASTFELWGALLHGAGLVLAPNRPLALADFERLVVAHKVTTLWLTAATFHLLAHHTPRAFATLQQLVVGGDVVSPTAVDAVQRACPALRIVNGYGPTETTTFALTYPVPRPYQALEALPIGKPLAHTSAYILDEELSAVPDGSEGQLALGGDGVALGYVNEPQLTASRFISDPFAPAPGARLYLTGDRAFKDARGTFHFRGRMDQEIKIAGHRVDPHEIESVLFTYPGVQHAAVFVRGDAPENKRLIAACQLHPQGATETELRAHLADRLPAYAVPTSISVLSSMPLSAHGKLDRPAILALLSPDAAHIPVAEPPRADEPDALSAVLAIWQTLLETVDISPDQNFFDAGGDSLLLIQLHWRLNQLNRGTIDLMDLFSATTPRKMASLLGEPVAVR